jgi:predicted Rossmann-fold nucleotide-binding protein
VQHPVGLLNTLHFFNPLLEQMHHMAAMGFLSEQYREVFIVEESPEKLLSRIPTQSF